MVKLTKTELRALRTMLGLSIDECKRRYRKDDRGRLYQTGIHHRQDAKVLHTVYTYGSRGVQDNRLYALLRELN